MQRVKLDSKIVLKDKTFYKKDLAILLSFEVAIIAISLFFTMN